MALSNTQLRYARAIAEEPGPVSAQELFNRLRFSKLSLSRMTGAGIVEKQMIDGRSHYRLTREGVAAIATAPLSAEEAHDVQALDQQIRSAAGAAWASIKANRAA